MTEKLALGAVTAQDIDKLRDGYRPAAKQGAILFFVLSDLASVNSMYQYSLGTYLEVFAHSLRRSQPHSYLPKRLAFIKETLTFNVYNYGCTGSSIMHLCLTLCSIIKDLNFITDIGAFSMYLSYHGTVSSYGAHYYLRSCCRTDVCFNK